MLPRLAAALCLICVCTFAAAAAPLRVAVPALPVQLDPHKAASPVDVAIARELFLGLVTRDALGNLVPGAASWQAAPDGLTYDFTLREGLVWSDGTPMEAADFVAGINRARDPATAAPFAAELAPLMSVVALNRRMLKITLQQYSATVLKSLSLPVAAPVPRHRLKALGEAWSLPENIVVNGAFTAARANGALVLNANPRAAIPARAPQVTFVAVPSAEDAAALIRAQQADLSLGFVFETPGLGAPARMSRTDQGRSLYFVIANTTRKPLSLRDVRHALAMTIDREGLLKTLRFAEAAPAYEMVPPGVYGGGIPGRAAYAALRADMRKAIAEVLLIESAITTTRPATFTLVYPKGDVHAAVAKKLAEIWAPLGVKLLLDEKTAADYGRTLRDGGFDLALGAWETTDTDPTGYLAPFAHGTDPRNPSRYGDTDFISRLRQADAQGDPAQRLIMLADAEAVLVQDQPILPIFFFTPARPVGGGVGNWQPNAHGVHPLHTLSR